MWLADTKKVKVFGVVVVLAAFVLVGWFYLTQPTYLDPSGDVSTARSVILVPGYGGGSENLVPLKGALAKEGYNVSILNIGEGTGDLALYGDMLAQEVKALRQSSGGSVHLVGFSAGGVIARAALSEDSAPDIARVITLGSPHRGTSIASVGRAFGGDQCPVACQQLARDSGFLNSLPLPSSTEKWLSVYSPSDSVVVPVDTAALNGSNIVNTADLCPLPRSLAHGDIPLDSAVISLVVDFIQTGSISLPSRGC